MPMLERTAASLEPCNFQRVLPPAKTPFTSRRLLHTTFWQHGAADIELSSVWQTLIREPLESLNLLPTSQSTRSEPLGTSAFLLDFLYPQGAASLLRKLSPSVLDKYERPRLYLRGPISRLFTSSASPSQQSRTRAQETTTVAPTGAVSAQDDTSAREEDLAEETDEEPDDGNGKEFDDQHAETEQGSELQNQSSYVRRTSREFKAVGRERVLGKLRELLQKDEEVDFDDIWQAYHAKAILLSDRIDHRAQFLDYVTKYRSMSHLLARAIKFKNWKTLWAMWERYPEAHSEGVQALQWEEINQVLSVDELMRGLRNLITRIQHAKHARGRVREAAPELSETLLRKVVDPCIRHYLSRIDPTRYIPLLRLLKDPLLYEEFLDLTTSKKDKAIAHELYTAYRRLPGVKIRGHIMHKMIDRVYFPEDPTGMELVMKDFYGRFGRLDIRGYRRYMEFYSRRGDVQTVRRLWDEYITHYAEERKPKPHYHKPLSDKPDFTPLLHVHAVRGELGEVRRVFSTAQNEYGPTLNVLSWNILLNAHAKAGEYDAAVRVFGVLRQAVVPDLYSYGTMMGMSGSRGDLEFTLELYRMAKNQGLEPNVTMVDCVVEAYCQNDKFNDAESIVSMTTKKGHFSRADLVVLWNTLLDYHADRRDLKTVNQLLNQMTEHNIIYDSETYSKLLRGLALCRQPHHALYLIQQAVKSHSFKPTLEHYALLMSAFIKSGQPGELFRTSTVLRDLGMPQTGSILLRVLQALGAWAQSPPGGDANKSRMYLLSALRQFRKSIEWSQQPQKIMLQHRPQNNPWLRQAPDPDTVGLRTDQASVLIFTFTQMRQVTTVQDILKLWKSSSPEASEMQEPPLKLLQSLMLSAFYEGNYDEVREIWQLTFDRAVHMSRVSAPGTRREEALPSMRYLLNNALKTMQRVYAAQDDADGLRETVASVLRAGFRLDSKNWNYYVQLLAGMKKWREAFVVCEDQLMPFWGGWARVRAKLTGVRTQLPLQVRRRGADPHLPRPISYTLTVLSKAYMDLEQMTAWSSEADRLLAYIVQKAPSAVAAVRTQLRTRNPMEERVLMGETKARVREQVGQKRRLRREQEDDVPEAFHEMMMRAVGGEEAGVDQGGWEVEEEEKKGEGDGDVGVDPAAAPVDGEVERGKDDEWYDVSEQDDDTWTPMTAGQLSADWQEIPDAEASVSGRVDSSAPRTEEDKDLSASPQEPQQADSDFAPAEPSPTSFDAEQAFLAKHFQQSTSTSSGDGRTRTNGGRKCKDRPDGNRTRSRARKEKGDDGFCDSGGNKVEGFGGGKGDGKKPPGGSTF